MNKKSTGKKIFKIALIVLGIIAVVFYAYIVYPLWGIPFNAQRHGNPPLTPAWALECWLWEDDINTAERVDELLEGYTEHDIPVRTIILDSPWTLRYNDFEVDEDLYPNPKEWFGKLQDQGYRVVLWMTTMVDSYSKDTKIKESDDWFNNAKESGYLVNDGKQISWWKGKGGFIDYTNPEAMKWWRGLQ
jgi:alpha-D-xyloside xylohydrolase